MLKNIDKALDKFFSVVSRICEYMGIIGLIGIMIMLVTQTILQWFKVSVLWSDEFVSFLNIWVVFTAASVVSHEKKHVKVDFFTEMMPKKVQILLDMVISVLIIYTCYHFFKGGIVFVNNTKNITTNILHLPMISMYCAPLIAIAFMGLMQIKDFIDLFAALLNRKEVKE